MNPLLAALLQNLIIPEITSFIRSRHAAGAPTPTDEEIFAQLEARNAEAQAIDAAWLAVHPAVDTSGN